MDREDETALAEPAIERLLDLAVYAPVGLFVTLRDDLPKQVRQRRQALENRVQLARFIGQLVVQQGRKEIAKRLDEAARERATAGAGRVLDAGSIDLSEAIETSPSDAPGAVPAAAASSIDPSTLPIAEYQSLAAVHVVQRLATLGPDELEQVRCFEEAHRARRTILAKIAQLQDEA
ncbi:MAG: hypothetical protein WD023_00070 [Ilumatobacteraceae bacterium]